MAKTRRKRLVDFCGFQFNGVHSSELGLTRVSDGSRYNENLVPDFSDKTVQIPGGDGMLYWESYYSSKKWTINVAFDDLSESEFRRLRQVFNTKQRGELIFDESPYKAYTVKIQSAPQFKTLCFDKPAEDGYETIVENEVVKVSEIRAGRTFSGKEIQADGNTIQLKSGSDWKNLTDGVILDRGELLDTESGKYYSEKIKINAVKQMMRDGVLQYPIRVGKLYTIENIDNLEITCDVTVTTYKKQSKELKRKMASQYERVYKGEGTINFISYYPYAQSVYNYIDEYEDKNAYAKELNESLSPTIEKETSYPILKSDDSSYSPNPNIYLPYPNIDEWREASGMIREDDARVGVFKRQAKKKTYGLDGIKVLDDLDDSGMNAYEVCLYNPGDVETDWALFFSFKLFDEAKKRNLPRAIILLDNNANILSKLVFNLMTPVDGDNFLCIDSRTNLMQGFSNISKSILPKSPSGTTGSVEIESRIKDDMGTFKINPSAALNASVGEIFPIAKNSAQSGDDFNQKSFVGAAVAATLFGMDLSVQPKTPKGSIATNNIMPLISVAPPTQVSPDDAVFVINVGEKTEVVSEGMIAEWVKNQDQIEYEQKLEGLYELFSKMSDIANAHPTGNLYNKYLYAGEFFKIPVGASKMIIIMNSIQTDENDITSDIKQGLQYNYLYY